MSGDSDGSFSKIVVAVDGSDVSLRAADTAIALGAKYGAELHVVHVVNIDQYLQSLGLYRVSYPKSIKKKVEEVKGESRQWFASIRQNAEKHGVRMQDKVIDSPLSIVAAIIEFAENEKADLVVIDTRGRPGFKRLILG